MEEMKVTTVSELSQYAKGTLLELPEFGAGQPFKAYVRRPSILTLASNGSIPNSLMSMAVTLFKRGGAAAMSDSKPEDVKEATKVFHILAKSALVSPTYDEIKEAGLELTDDQLAFLFSYTQQGTKALERFRCQSENYKRAGNRTAVRKTAVGNNKG